MSVYIFLVSVIMYFFVDNMWDIEYDNATETYIDGVPTPKATVYTMIFNTFVWLHIFNEFNCRKVGATQYNVFNGLIANWMFLVVVGSLMALQVLGVQYGGSAIGCVALTMK